MSRRRLALLALAAPVLLLPACGSDGGGSTSSTTPEGGLTTIAITLSDAGCEPRSIAASAGPTTFAVTNDGTAAVTEFEVMEGDSILGEVENVIPGDEREFSLTLEPGSYTTYCPGGSDFEEGTLEVAAAPTGVAADSEARQQAVAGYLDYVTTQAEALQDAIAPFAQAVEDGDLEAAKQQYAAARYHYETIEPIAESFGDLDPRIDAREGDGPDAEWGGFHRLEKALWVDGSTDGMAPVAQQLVADVDELRASIDGIELEPAQIANGAVELLDEVSTSKITGEEDRYSHTDLSDFAANLAGAQAAFDALEPLVADEDPGLVSELQERFAAVQADLEAYAGDEPTGNGFVLYTTLTPEQTRQLASSVDSLAEPLSRVAAIVIE